MNTKIASAIAIIAVLAMVVAVIPSVDGTDETETVLPTEGDLVSVTMDGSTFTNDTFDGSGTMIEAIAAINASVSGQPDHNNHFVISVNQSFSTAGFTVGSSATTDGTVDVILNVNGYHLEVTSGATVSSGSSLTINGGTNSENTNGSMSKQMASALITNHGNLTLNNVDVTGTNTLFYQNRSGSVGVINGGTIYSSNVAYDLDNGELTILSGSVTAQYPAVRMDAGKLTIGEQDSDSTTDPYVGRLSTNSNSINFYSGYVTDVTSSVHFPSDSILEGTFGLIIDANIPPGTYISGTSGSYRVERLTEENAGAMIESMGSATQYFSSIGSASSFMEDGDKLTLLESYTGPSLVFDIYSGIIDLNGNSITINDGQYGISVHSSNRTPSGSQQVQIINSSETESTITAALPINVSTGNSMNTIELQLGEGIVLSASGTEGSIVLGSGTYAVYTDDMRDSFLMGAFISEMDGTHYISGSLSASYDLDDNNEIRMINDYDGVLIFETPGDYILDLGNNKVESDSTYGINIAENGVHVKIMNGSINVDRNGRSANEIIAVQVGIPPEPAPGDTQRVYDDLSLTLEKVTVTTDGYWGIDTNGNNTDIVIELIDSSVESEGHGIYFPATGSVSLKNSSVSGDVTGIEMRRGSLSIEGTSTVSGGTDFDSFPSTGGTAVNGVAIAIAPYSSETPIEVSITSGTFAGYHGLYEEDVIDVGLGQTSISVRGGSFYGTSQPVKIADVDSDSNPLISNFITGGAFYTGTTVNATPVDSLPTGYIPTGYEVSTYKPGTVEVSDPDAMVVQTSDGVQYASLQEAIEAVPSGTEIDLIASVNENITIPSGKTIILDLNGNKLQSPEDSTEDLIVVESGGNLTIRATGGGTVDCTVNGKACLVNNGTVVIEGGDFIRSKQAFDTEYPATGGSWKHTHYVIENDGTMTIEGGSIIMGFEDDSTEGGYYLGNVSSVITNGQTNTSGSAKLTINGGDFIGAANIVKNNSGVLTITDGTFTMDNRAHRWVGGNNMVQNAPDSTMNITGGDFYAYGYGGAIDDDDWARHGIYNSGTANVSGITLTMEGQYSDGIVQSNTATGDMSLSDCTVTVDVNDPTSRAIVVGTNASDHQVVISSGTYTGTVVASSPELQIVGGAYSHSGDISAFIDPSLEYEDDGSGNIVVTTPQIFSVGSMYALSEHFRLPLAVESTEGIQFYFPTGVSYDKGTGVVTISATAESEFTITASLSVNGYEEKLTVSNISGMVTAQDSEIELIVYSSDEIDDIVRERLSQMSGFGESVQMLSLDVSRVDGETEGVPFVIGVPNMFEGYEFTVVHFTDDGYDIPSFQISDGSITISPTSFSPFALVWYEPVTEPEPTPDPDPGWNPGWDDDDYVPIPPVIVDDSSDDDTVKIVACAAAAVVAAIMAAFLILGHRRE